MASAAFVLLLAVFGVNEWVVRSGDSRVFAQSAALPVNDVGLVLGTARLVSGGRENLHFHHRIAAAAELFKAGKVRHLLLSGDNHIQSYDEPTDMKNALRALGVPESAMTLDYAGFRTLDSVVRARKVFGQSQMTIITDDFHVHRAVFLARHRGVDAVAFCSERVPASWSYRSRVRECAARCLAVIDLFLLHRQPKFLGEKIPIQITASST